MDTEVKKHYIKEQYEDIMRKKGDIQCVNISSMDIERDIRSQFCFFYKNLLTSLYLRAQFGTVWHSTWTIRKGQ